jgi:hypothetical protein
MKRFQDKIKKTESCWIWIAGKNSTGYGIFRFEGNIELAHRVSYFTNKNQSINRNIFVLHKCDNPPCVNPDHLFEGTHSDNMIDMVRKKRNVSVGHSRKTHCKKGHEFTTENTLVRPNLRGRSCRECDRIRHDSLNRRGPYIKNRTLL